MSARFCFIAPLLVAQGIYCYPVFATDTVHHTKSWNRVGISGSFGEDKRILYNVEPNLRFIDLSNKYEFAYIEASIGNQLFPSVALWFGTECGALPDSGDGLNYAISLWQQISWTIFSNDNATLSDRTRIEELYRESQSGIALRLRQKFELLLPLDDEKKYSILLNDEIFFNVNHPPWMSNTLVDQNRCLVALRTRLNKSIFFDIGYMNQYQYNSTNQQSNILSLSLGIKNS